MESEEEAKEAIQKFHGGELDGNTIIVSEAKPKKDSDRGRGHTLPVPVAALEAVVAEGTNY